MKLINLILDLEKIDNPYLGFGMELQLKNKITLSRKLRNSMHHIWMMISLVLVLSLPILILSGLLMKSSLLMEKQSLFDLLFSSEWQPLQGKFGFLSFILSSVFVSIISIIFAALISLMTAIHLVFYTKKRVLKIIRPIIDILAGIPSVVYGVWGIIFLIPLVSNHLAPAFGKFTSGYCLISGALVLSIMIIPFVLNILIELFRNIPKGLIESSYSLGSTKWETVKYVALNKSKPGIISAVTLGLSRAFGETIAVLMVVGNIVKIPKGLFDAAYPIPALIANNYGEMMSIPLYDSALMFAALILLVVVTFFNIIARYLITKMERKV